MSFSVNKNNRMFENRRITASGTGETIPIDTASNPFFTSIRDFTTLTYLHKGDEGEFIPTFDRESKFIDSDDISGVQVELDEQASGEERIFIIGTFSEARFDEKVEEFTRQILNSNHEFDEIDENEFIDDVIDLFDELDKQEQTALTDQELKSRIRKLGYVELTAGLLEDLNEEERRAFEESFERRPLF